MIARCDGKPIIWPEPTHAPMDSEAVKAGLLKPYVGAYTQLGFSLPCPSIFDTSEEIKEKYEKGQPILVGTASVEKSERISKDIKRIGIPHNLLNAKNHELESQIVAQSGRVKSVTIATNMAGRGTDILLGGNPEFLAKQKLLNENVEQDEQPLP